MWWVGFGKEVRNMTLIATIIVWAIIEALCAKNPAPLMVLIVLFAFISMVAEIMY